MYTGESDYLSEASGNISPRDLAKETIWLFYMNDVQDLTRHKPMLKQPKYTLYLDLMHRLLSSCIGLY